MLNESALEESLNETTVESVNEKKTACPTVECPACPPCQEPSDERLKLSLNEMELFTTTEGSTTDVTVVKLSEKEFDMVKSATLRFTPQCQDPGVLTIAWEGTEVYKEKPVCGRETALPLDPGLLTFGRNTLLFTSAGDEDYEIVDIALDLHFLNGSNETKRLFRISFTPSDREEESFRVLDDLALKNYVEYELHLSKEEAKKDYVLRFNSDDVEGNLRVLLNENEVFHGEVQRRLNEITLPHDLLRRGTNYVTFILVS